MKTSSLWIIRVALTVQLIGVLAVLAFLVPRGISYPIGVIAAWFAVALLSRGIMLRSRRE